MFTYLKKQTIQNISKHVKHLSYNVNFNAVTLHYFELEISPFQTDFLTRFKNLIMKVTKAINFFST